MHNIEKVDERERCVSSELGRKKKESKIFKGCLVWIDTAKRWVIHPRILFTLYIEFESHGNKY